MMIANNVKDIENDYFRLHHHNLRVKASDGDPFVSVSYKRKCLAQYHYASLSLLDEEGCCQIWEDKVRPYFALVDDTSDRAVNNYANSVLALTSKVSTNDPSKWKSTLRCTRPIAEVIKRLKLCPNGCHEMRISDEDLLTLFKKGINESENDKWPMNNEKSNVASGGASMPSQTYSTASKLVSSCGSASDNISGGFFNSLHQQKNAPAQADQFNTDGVVGFASGSVGGFQMNSWTSARIPGSNVPESAPLFGARGSIGQCRIPGSNLPESAPFFGARGSIGRRRGVGRVYGNQGVVGRVFEDGGNSHQNYRGNMHQDAPNHPSSSSSYNSRGGINMSNNVNTSAHQEAGMSSSSAGFFRTAKEEYSLQNLKKYGSRGGNTHGSGPSRGAAPGPQGAPKRSLGTARRAGVHGKFVPPVRPTEEDDFGGMFGVKQPQMEEDGGEEVDERLKNIDPKMVETIRNEIMDIGAPVTWDDIAGLQFAKTTIQEIVVWPLLRPDIFTGLRKPPKGLLLFGPPGTGKTLIGKCIASQSHSTFFSISASSLTSKWIGDGEKMVRALFAVARVHQPSVVFIDEIDSLLTQRSDTEHESSRRIKTEFLVQLDGAATGDEERILIVGATNRPQELDEAARRRLVKRLYIPLPEHSARRQIVERLMSTERSALTDEQITDIATLTDGYSGADMKTLCQEASLGPIRSISFTVMHQITADQVRPINVDDFKSALQRVRASVSNKDLDAYVKWDKTYGMGNGM